MWFVVAPRVDTKNHVLKEIGLHVECMITILGLIVNITRGGGYYMTI